MISLGILLIIIGLFMLIRPQTMWVITESWKSSDATEPSGLYKLSTRIGGGLFTLAGIGAMVAFIIG
ncbi:DUF6199 family natural product biosynthesis protein [Paenibacillus sp. y28]|uniref:DUF6199 family natural product biosynthesis protein n=1 Tax=Paenibacillus sp. y28 TaxID=3129110 RepID=UPI00301B5FBB